MKVVIKVKVKTQRPDKNKFVVWHFQGYCIDQHNCSSVYCLLSFSYQEILYDYVIGNKIFSLYMLYSGAVVSKPTGEITVQSKGQYSANWGQFELPKVNIGLPAVTNYYDVK